MTFFVDSARKSVQSPNVELKQEWLSRGEAATRLGVSVSTIRTWERTGVLVPHRNSAGTMIRFRVSDVDAILRPTPKKTTT